MLGTIVNAGAIIVGGAIGSMVGARLPARLQKIVFQGLGIITMTIGVSMALKTPNFLVVALSVVTGAIVGELLGIEKWLERLPRKFLKSGSASRAVEGFVTSSLLFCVGSMAILGSIEDGLGQHPTLLYTKSVMDGITTIAFAATFGIAVVFSALPVLIYQGTITLAAVWITSHLDETMIAQLTSVGGIMLVGLGLNILEIKEIKVTNMLPALLLTTLFTILLG